MFIPSLTANLMWRQRSLVRAMKDVKKYLQKFLRLKKIHWLIKLITYWKSLIMYFQSFVIPLDSFIWAQPRVPASYFIPFFLDQPNLVFIRVFSLLQLSISFFLCSYFKFCLFNRDSFFGQIIAILSSSISFVFQHF